MDRRIQKAYDLIKRNFQSKLLLKDLAESVGISPFHLQKLFKSELGVSPAQCLVRVRLERARHLLHIDPSMPLAAVANNCGFSSLSVFSRAFSNYYGHQAIQLVQNLRKQTISHKVEPIPVEVVYFPDTSILYEHTNMYRKDLHLDFTKVAQRAKQYKILVKPPKIGVLTHIAFHGRKDQLNYYAGLKIYGAVPKRYQEDVFIIPAGKYAAFQVREPHDQLVQAMLRFKKSWLDNSRYVIRDIFAFEEYLESDIHESNRMVYVPLKPKK